MEEWSLALTEGYRQLEKGGVGMKVQIKNGYGSPVRVKLDNVLGFPLATIAIVLVFIFMVMLDIAADLDRLVDLLGAQ